MDNRKKRKNKQKSKPISNDNTKQLNAKPQQAENELKNEAIDTVGTNEESVQTENKEEKSKDTDSIRQGSKVADKELAKPEKTNVQPQNNRAEKTATVGSTKPAEKVKAEANSEAVIWNSLMQLAGGNIKETVVKAAKILLPAAACVIVIAVIVSYIGSQRTKAVENPSSDTEVDGGVVTLSDKPLEENAYSSVNELMNTFYRALADGDMETVRAIKDYNDDKEIITYEKKSEFIEYYDNINCYTKPGISDNTYFVYVTYTVKIQDIETKAPGLNAWYVYTAEDGSLKIDGDTEENIKAAFKLVTSQDDVVDLYNKIDVSYKEAVAADEALSVFLEELPVQIKTSVGEALAQLETQESNAETSQTEALQPTADEQTQPAESEVPSEAEAQPQNQIVNQIVKATDTVNVRSSDSEEADKIGKVQSGTELTRVEERINGWSKVIFEDREAYIKSDYLEVVTAEVTVEPIGTVTARTNVNVRSQPDQESAKLGTAQAGMTYDLLEDQGEWFKVNYNGTTGFVKAEFFEK
ncbi:MAG: SH3 domain-containing protein [Lachnospiraceae bacterium]|nr:SH3 domain-containing protein [Lachnospiraceae bacterium]